MFQGHLGQLAPLGHWTFLLAEIFGFSSICPNASVRSLNAMACKGSEMAFGAEAPRLRIM